ncbi:hypothetical protein ACFL52_02905 [Candidatus Margulisiibacteriota bacterium]
MKKQLAILLFFTIISIIMTYPLIFKMHNNLTNLNDPIKDVWSNAWISHKLSTNMSGFFDGNIFYPNKNALAYSEYYLAAGLLAWPINQAFNNPILTYNIFLLASFIFSCFGMYLLVQYLTRNKLAAIVAGLIYGFCNYRFGHISHLNLFTAQWIPFILLYIHKTFKEKEKRNVIYFVLFFLLQALSSIHYALFLVYLIPVAVIYFIITYKTIKDLQIWLRMIGAALVILTILFAAYHPLLSLKGERSLQQHKYFSARIGNYLASSKTNLIYGRLTKNMRNPEGYFFPGILTIILALYAFKSEKKEKSGWKIRAVKILLLLSALILFVLIIADRNNPRVYFALVRILSVKEYLLLFLSLTSAYLLVNQDLRIQLIKVVRSSKVRLFYLVLLVVSFLLSLGPEIYFARHKLGAGPYLLLYKYLPGFNGMRVPARIAVFFFIALAVLAGYGVRKILGTKLFQKQQWLVAGGIAIIVLLESFSVPIPFYKLEQKMEFPAVYHWLKTTPKDSVILELPIAEYDKRFGNSDIKYMYYSTLHWRSLVNGFRSNLPQNYNQIVENAKRLPESGSINFFKKMGVDIIVVHGDICPIKKWDNIKSIKQFKNDLVYMLK